MARLRIPLYASLAALLMAAPAFASAAGFFGPVVPQTGSCACGNLPMDWGCVLQVLQNLIELAVSLGVILCVIWIAYAGFTLMTSGGSPEARSLGKTRAMNALFGIMVILCSWLIVDFVMKVVYNPDQAFSGGTFGPWNTILGGNGKDFCIQVHQPTAITAGSIASTLTSAAPGTSSTALSNAGTGACSASVVQQGAAAGGYQISNQQANELACIAQHESSCGTARGIGNPNYSWNKANSKGKASTAAGPYQVLLRTNAACYQNAACTAAAGGQQLNCKNAFNSNGLIVNSALANQCLSMAGNTACSASAAACQMQTQSFASMYATDPDVGKCSAGS